MSDSASALTGLHTIHTIAVLVEDIEDDESQSTSEFNREGRELFGEYASQCLTRAAVPTYLIRDVDNATATTVLYLRPTLVRSRYKITGFDAEDELVAFSLSLELKRLVLLKDNTTVPFLATVWQCGYTGLVSRSKLAEELLRQIERQCNKFAQAYKAA